MKITPSSDSFDIDINACSTTDCTGLIPFRPYTDDELESYESLYRYIPPVANAEDKDS